MLTVMPQGHAPQGAGVGPLVRIPGEISMFSERLPKDPLEDVISGTLLLMAAGPGHQIQNPVDNRTLRTPRFQA